MRYPSHLGRARRRRLHAFVATNDQLRYFSSYIPGGVGMMISLMRLSQNDKVRQIAFAWNDLPRKEHRTVNLDRLSSDAGVAPAEVFDDIIGTAGGLNMDCSELIRALHALPGALRAAEARAIAESRRDREPFLRASGFLSGRNTMITRGSDAIVIRIWRQWSGTRSTGLECSSRNSEASDDGKEEIVAANWWGGDRNPQRSTPQDPIADQRNPAGAVSTPTVQVERPSEPWPPKRAQGLPNQPHPSTLYAGTISAAPRHSVRQTRKAPLMTAWGHQLCEEVKQLRRQLGISQTQLARLGNVGLRTVKGWEAHRGKPLARTRTLLEHFRRYVEAKGLQAFHQRYVREEPRYHKSGPADRLAENAFDSRVAADSPSAFAMR